MMTHARARSMRPFRLLAIRTRFYSGPDSEQPAPAEFEPSVGALHKQTSRPVAPLGDRIPRSFTRDGMTEQAQMAEGVLELHPRGHGFLRAIGRSYAAGSGDPFVPPGLIQK